jgi:small-conductance mechanosensitive channel
LLAPEDFLIMVTPIPSPEQEHAHLQFIDAIRHSSEEEGTIVSDGAPPEHQELLHNRLAVETSYDSSNRDFGRPSPSKTREEAHRFDDDLAMLQAEQVATNSDQGGVKRSAEMHRSRSRAEPVDTFDASTNPIHEKAALYRPPERPSTKVATFFKYIHTSSWLVRYVTYISPIVIILLIPLLVGALVPRAKGACVGGVQLLWFSIWLEIVWLTLWAGRLAAKLIPWPMGLVSSLFTNNSKKWRDLGKQLEIPATLFFWWLGILISFLPTMRSHHCLNNGDDLSWTVTVNKIIVSFFVLATLNFIEKIIIQLIAISFHLRTYADRIELNKFQIGSLTKLYAYSKQKIAAEDSEFEQPSGPASGARTPAMYAEKIQRGAREAFAKVGDVAGTVAGDFTGKMVAKSGHPHQVVLTLLNSPSGSQVLARRMYRTFVREGCETVSSDDLKNAFDNDEEEEAAFNMFDKDMNGDISMEELEAVCVEIGRERKSITASLKDLDSVVSKLDSVLFFVVLIVSILVLISLISTSAAGVLTSAGSAVLALSWLFSATAQEFLQSVIFVFVKHPFDVGDRVTIYGNTGSTLKGDDYFVKEISLLYTEFKKMEGHNVQAPNSYLNTLFILNQRRSGGLAEAVPVVIRFGTTLHQIESLRNQLLEFVKSEKREYQGNILTELRDVTEVFSLTLNIVFFYKSNWQNELVRLQRRNKFICAMMIAMQELGIEGPRRMLAGNHTENPYYVQQLHAQPTTAIQSDGPNGLQRSPQSSVPVAQHPSILRHRAPSQGYTRGRSESLSQMGKRVDFSLGMRDVSSGDLPDLYEGRGQSRVTETIREANREEAERRIEEEEIDEHGEAVKASGRSRSRDVSESHHSPHLGGILRRSTTRSMGHHNSVSSQETHRNRFFPRFGRNADQSFDLPRVDVEQGRMDPRSGTISNQAQRMDSNNTEPFPTAPTRSQTDDIEMRRFTDHH